MNKLLPAIITVFLFAVTAFGLPPHAYAAVSLKYDKTAVSVPQNSTFTLTVNINVDSLSASSGKATVKYASADLDIVQVTKGGFFPEFAQANDSSAGLLELTGYTTSPGSGYSGSGNLATITLKAKKGSGSSVVAVGCDGSFHDSNILTVSGDQVLQCSQTNQVSVNYTSSGSPTNTPTPTPAPDATPTPTPVQTQNTVPVCANLAADKTTGTGTPLAVTFTCSGVDTNGYINGAYFDFGDGTTDTITKNVGSPGAISTTHTYNTIGALGVSCKVKDNDSVWSQVPDLCKKIITIKPKPRVIVRTITPPPANQIIPTPTPVDIVLTFVTPTATPSPDLTPTLVPLPDETETAFPWWMLPVGAILLGGILYILGKRKPGAPPAPPGYPPSGTPPVQ